MTYMPQQISSPSPPPRMLTGSAVICSAGFCDGVSDNMLHVSGHQDVARAMGG